MRKAAGPDNIQLLTTCFKTTIVPVSLLSLNDYRHVALAPTLMKCLEKLVLQHIKDNILAEAWTLTSLLLELTDPQMALRLHTP